MRRIAILAALVATGSATGLAVAQQQGGAAPFTISETGQGYAKLDDAVTAIWGDTATIVIAPGVYRDCAVQTGGRITYKAAVPGQVILDGTPCEGKAALVLRGHHATVDGIIFRNIRVPDGNGAGIRVEEGSLDVRNSMFLDSEEGILGGNEPKAITVDQSTFAGLGRCDRDLDCAHGIYLGQVPSVKITRSRFERGNGGHYVKLRARRVEITDSSFDDSAGRETNYMIDLPAGSTGTIRGNTFVQGKSKENWTGFIVVAAEGKENSSSGLAIAGNTVSLAPGAREGTSWVADYSGDRLAIGQNTLASGIRPFESR